MKALVTGAAGFIGTHLVEALLQRACLEHNTQSLREACPHLPRQGRGNDSVELALQHHQGQNSPGFRASIFSGPGSQKN